MKKSELRQLIKEEISKVLNELKPWRNPENPYYVLGFEIGPNAQEGIDPNGPEAKYVMRKAKGNYVVQKMAQDENLIQFTRGYVDSISDSRINYNGVNSIITVLTKLAADGWPKPGYTLGADLTIPKPEYDYREKRYKQRGSF